MKRDIRGFVDRLEIDFIDIAKAEEKFVSEDLCLMLHCGENVHVVLQGQDLILSHPDSKYQLSLRLPTDQCRISFNEGEVAPIRGITGVGFMQHTAINTVTCKVSFNEFLPWSLRASLKISDDCVVQ